MYLHNNGCQPNQSQLMRSDKASAGSYNKSLTFMQLDSIIAIIKSQEHSGAFVLARIFHPLVTPLYPQGYPVTSHVINNMQLKVKKLLKNRDSCASQLTSKAHDYLLSKYDDDALDNQPPEFLDVASAQHIRERLKSALNEDNNALWIEKLLKELAEKDEGFTYRICYASDGTRTGYTFT